MNTKTEAGVAGLAWAHSFLRCYFTYIFFLHLRQCFFKRSFMRAVQLCSDSLKIYIYFFFFPNVFLHCVLECID